MSSTIQRVGTALFAVAVLHTFAARSLQGLARHFRKGSTANRLLHLLGEVEIVFGLWAGVLLAVMTAVQGFPTAVGYLNERDFGEPAFVFAVMTVAATAPIIAFATRVIRAISRVLPLPPEGAFFISALSIGPLLGSFITEPAAMTVIAFVLKERFFERGISLRLRYLTLAVLFVNISIGGLLTPFAAPPVLMVAETWHWGLAHMLVHFGWKATVAIVFNAAALGFLARHELRRLEGGPPAHPRGGSVLTPRWLEIAHLVFLAAIVLTSHWPLVFLGFFLFFLGLVDVTTEHQERLRLRESLLVSFFLGGLVVLGGFQQWWLEPLLARLQPGQLFLGATALTAITDNAALTYLGAQVPGLAAANQYALVAGAVSGGGLTVIANAPNPAGFSILRDCFGADGISPFGLLAAALVPTVVAMACLWFL